jgi:hypothetical protein
VKREIVSYTRRINGSYMARVVCTPTWFERVLLRRKPMTFDLAIPRKISGHKVTVAKLINQYLKENL